MLVTLIVWVNWGKEKDVRGEGKMRGGRGDWRGGEERERKKGGQEGGENGREEGEKNGGVDEGGAGKGWAEELGAEVAVEEV